MRYYNKLLILAIVMGTLSGCSTSSSTDTSTSTTDEVILSTDTNTSATDDTTTDTNDSIQTQKDAKSINPSGWYMRVVAKATDDNDKVYTHNSAGVFGELDESSDSLDRHDIPAKGSAILQVRFINPNLDKDTQYYSDYHSYKQDTTKESWGIVIINDDSNIDLSDAKLNLDIQNLKNIYKINGKYKEVTSLDTTKRDSLNIVDIDNQKVYTYQELINTDLSMDDKHSREFRVVLGDVTQEDMESWTTTDTQAKLVKQFKVVNSTKGFGQPPE